MSDFQIFEPTVAALIDENGMFVEDVMVLDSELTEFHVRERSPGGFIHPKWNGTAWVEGRTDKILDALKARRTEEVNIVRDTKYNAGMVFEGNTFQIDLEAQKDMSAVRLALVTGLANAHGGFWRTSDNVMVAMDDVKVVSFINTVMGYVQQIKAVSWYHKDAIASLNTVEAVAGYDMTIGWPS